MPDPIKNRLLVFCLLWSVSLHINAEFDHTIWSDLLADHVVSLQEGRVTQVSYDSMLADRELLRNYLADLERIGKAEFDGWSGNEQLAFLLNAYNAWTIELVLTEYPNLDSIRDLGFFFRSPWRKKFIPLFGEQVSLDNIEHDMIRGSGLYNEPRIHFAINCAAIGCPGLHVEAYQANKLEQQLEHRTILILSDRSRNYYSDSRLYISRLFDWYEEDFTRGWRGTSSVAEFLSLYVDALELPPEASEKLQTDNISIRHLKYDWILNRTP